VVGLWLLHADEVVRLFRPGCKTCRRQPGDVGAFAP
jgi:hypothetical protein